MDDEMPRGDEVPFIPDTLPRVAMPAPIPPRLYELAAECADESAEHFRAKGETRKAEHFAFLASRYRRYARRATQ